MPPVAARENPVRLKKKGRIEMFYYHRQNQKQQKETNPQGIKSNILKQAK